MSQRRFERSVFGSPAVPPGRLVMALNACRRRLLGTHRAIAPPPVRILEALFAQLDASVLALMVDLDVPDLLDDRVTIDDLARRTGVDRHRLERVVRYAAARGLMSMDRRGNVRPNGVTRALRSDAPASWRGWVRFATSDWFASAWRHLGPGLESDAPSAFAHAHGREFFGYITDVDPGAGRVFDQAMEAGATVQAIGLARALDWSGVRSVCDVGGGTGAALGVLQRYHPRLDVTLLDLPEVVARARFTSRAEAPGRREIVGGSFFDAVPAGRDRYLALAVVHDWDDEHALSLLSRVRDAMPADGRAIVVEHVASPTPRDDFATASDLLMLVLSTGRERTHDEYECLFASAGLSIATRELLATGATAFVLRRREPRSLPTRERTAR